MRGAALSPLALPAALKAAEALPKTVRTGLPTPTWRKLHEGVKPGASRRSPIMLTECIESLEEEVDGEEV